VPKILVADDNSNIQKMVGLALKDQGIDLVAVGNGEAAVRKISDIRPDLVLADVFMPVRNGYEVCNYVKKDAALSHIPVILLVGAFDPLDEQEAQRVGADGVLKKPFVPPDPLISMVKSALTRAGVVLGAADPVSAPTSTPPPPIPTASSKPAPTTLPRVAPPPPPAMIVPEPEIDLGVPVFSAKPAPLSIHKNEQPLAFGSLLDSPPQEEEPVLTSTSGAAIAPERDWGDTAEAEEEEEVEEDQSKNAAWRVSSSIDEVADTTPAGQTDWREAAFAGIGAAKAQEWAPSVEKNSLSITEEEAAEIAKKQNPFVAEAVARVPEDWSQAIDAVFPEKPSESQTTPEPVVSAPEIPAAIFASIPASETAETYSKSPSSAGCDSSAPGLSTTVSEPAPAASGAAINSWMAGAVSPWESELQRANDLASSWDATKMAPAAVIEDTEATQAFLDSGLLATAHEHVVEAIEEVTTEQPAAVDSEIDAAKPIENVYSPALHETQVEAHVPAGLVRDLAPDFATHLAPQPEPDLAIKEPSAAPEIAAPVPAPSPNMDELVAKVLAKMNPDVLQAVTREILKPVIEALVKDELNKK